MKGQRFDALITEFSEQVDRMNQPANAKLAAGYVPFSEAAP
jgi:hypothetical protein